MGDDLFGVSWEVFHIMKSELKNAVFKEVSQS